MPDIQFIFFIDIYMEQIFQKKSALELELHLIWKEPAIKGYRLLVHISSIKYPESGNRDSWLLTSPEMFLWKVAEVMQRRKP